MYVACHVPGPEPVELDGRLVRADAWVVVDDREGDAPDLIAAGELHPYPMPLTGPGQPAEALAAQADATRLNNPTPDVEDV